LKNGPHLQKKTWYPNMYNCYWATLYVEIHYDLRGHKFSLCLRYIITPGNIILLTIWNSLSDTVISATTVDSTTSRFYYYHCYYHYTTTTTTTTTTTMVFFCVAQWSTSE